MPDYRVPRGCTGLQMQDGTRYPASRDGRIVVDRADHARHIERVGHNGGGHIHKSTGAMPLSSRSKYCEPCRFTGYAWQDSCPRCHRPLDDPADAAVATATA